MNPEPTHANKHLATNLSPQAFFSLLIWVSLDCPGRLCLDSLSSRPASWVTSVITLSHQSGFVFTSIQAPSTNSLLSRDSSSLPGCLSQHHRKGARIQQSPVSVRSGIPDSSCNAEDLQIIATVGKCMRGVCGKDLNIISMLKNLRKEALKFKAILGYVARRCLQTPKAERL